MSASVYKPKGWSFSVFWVRGSFTRLRIYESTHPVAPRNSIKSLFTIQVRTILVAERKGRWEIYCSSSSWVYLGPMSLNALCVDKRILNSMRCSTGSQCNFFQNRCSRIWLARWNKLKVKNFKKNERCFQSEQWNEVVTHEEIEILVDKTAPESTANSLS